MFSGTFETEAPIIDILVRMAMAMLCGGIIGLERELKDRTAGLRTNMLVSLASATFMILAAELILEATEATEVVKIDTLRIIEAVIGGVAFLGAGAIIRAGGDIRGLTTGASLWMSGAIGLACGGGYFIIAVIAAILAVVTLHIMAVIERRILDARDRAE